MYAYYTYYHVNIGKTVKTCEKTCKNPRPSGCKNKERKKEIVATSFHDTDGAS
jgi:hypothetical protein